LQYIHSYLTFLCLMDVGVNAYPSSGPYDTRISIQRWKRTIATYPNDPDRYAIRIQSFAVPGATCFRNNHKKAQGDSWQLCGLNLRLYVACSRVGTSSYLFVYAPDRKTIKIMYPEALQYILLIMLIYNNFFTMNTLNAKRAAHRLHSLSHWSRLKFP